MNDTARSKQVRFEQVVEQKLGALQTKIGEPYTSRRQVKVTALHWPDVVWFDTKLPADLFRPILDYGVPVVGFEIESTGSVQSIKAAINNLEALKPAIGCIVIPADVASKERYPTHESDKYGRTTREAVVYLAGRSWLPIVVLTEEDIDSFISGSQDTGNEGP